MATVILFNCFLGVFLISSLIFAELWLQAWIVVVCYRCKGCLLFVSTLVQCGLQSLAVNKPIRGALEKAVTRRFYGVMNALSV